MLKNTPAKRELIFVTRKKTVGKLEINDSMRNFECRKELGIHPFRKSHKKCPSKKTGI